MSYGGREEWGDDRSQQNSSFGRGRGRGRGSSPAGQRPGAQTGFQSRSNTGSNSSYQPQNGQPQFNRGMEPEFGTTVDTGQGFGNSDVVMVERRYVGRVIGKQGSKIRELQESTGCEIKIKKEEETDVGTPAYLTGSAEACALAKRMILELCSDDGFDSRTSSSNWRSSNDASSRGSRSGFGGAANSSGDSSDVVMVERQYVGRVIGRQGSKIRELQETSGCEIKIRKEEETDSGTPIYLTGSEEACRLAKRLIVELTTEDRGFDSRSGNDGGSRGQWGEPRSGFGGRPRQEAASYSSGGSTDVVMVERQFVGRVIGKQGSKIRELQETSGCEIKIRKEEETDSGTPIYLTGSEESCRVARRLIEELTSEDRSFDSRSGNDAGGRGGQWGEQRSGFGGKPRQDAGSYSGGSSDVVIVERQFVGRVIGKQGSKIRELQETSGCEIKIRKEEETDAGTPIYLSGSEEACALAKRLIEELCTEDRGSFDNRSGNDSGRNGFGGGNAGEESSQIMIPTSKIGMVIGKRGAKIREIQESTGCKINLPREDVDGLEAPVMLYGSEEARRRAEEIIEELVSDNLSIFSV